MRSIKNDFQNSDPWKIILIIKINFISSKDAEKEHLLHSTRNNVKFTPYSDGNEVIDEIWNHFVQDIKEV